MKRIFMLKNNTLLINLITYFIMALLGAITMLNPAIGFDKPALYSSILFFIIAFFSFGGYFYAKSRTTNYEILLFSLTCVLVAAYLFIFEYASLSYALGTAFLAFTVLNTINRIYQIDSLKKEKNPMHLMRAIALIIILFLSTLTIQNFYREISEVQIIMVGYYFLSYGILSLIEIIILIYIKPKSFEKFINGDFGEIKAKKINKFNENVDKLDEIVKDIKTSKKSKKKKSLKK